MTVRSEAELLNFLREVECLAALRHPNVVPFLGAVLQVGASSSRAAGIRRHMQQLLALQSHWVLGGVCALDGGKRSVHCR